MAGKKISAAEAVKAFKAQSIIVQVARRTKIKGADGKTREVFEVKDKPLAEEHVLAAYDHGERVVMTTINGRKYEAAVRGAAA